MATRIGSCAPTGEMPTVDVSGMVVQPCTIPLTEGLTLGQAIEKAGGATEFASPKRVVIYRDGRQAAYDRTDERTLAIQLKRGDSVQVSGRPMEPR